MHALSLGTAGHLQGNQQIRLRGRNGAADSSIDAGRMTAVDHNERGERMSAYASSLDEALFDDIASLICLQAPGPI